MTLRYYPDQQGDAAYTLLERGQTRSIEASLSDGQVEVSIIPELSGWSLEHPSGQGG
jgi:hypothetical protein